MSGSEAAERWNIDPSNIRLRHQEFPEGTIRKFGKSWVVTEEGMYAVFGRPRKVYVEIIRTTTIESVDQAVDTIQKAEIDFLIEDEGEESVVGMIYGIYQVMDDEDEYRDVNKTGTFLFFPDDGRIAIEYGADYEWADVDSIEEGLDLYFNDHEEYENRN